MKRIVPLLVVALMIGLAWWSGLAETISWANLGRQQDALRHSVGQRPIVFGAAYVTVYATFVALSLPQAVVLTIAGGLLFGAVAGGALAVLAATIGAVLLFLLARSALGDALVRRGGRLVQAARAGLERDGFHYLLAIRLIPVGPFWLVNLDAAAGGVRLLPYAAATLIGVAPGTFVFASVGAGIGDVLAAGGRPDLSIILTWPVLGPLLGLAALALLPVAWRRWGRRVGSHGGPHGGPDG